MRWAEVKIETGPGAADAVGNVLRQAGCAGLLICESPDGVVGYLPTDDRLEGRLEYLKDALVSLPDYGLCDADTEITLRYVEEEDWENGWKAFYKPMRVGRRLVVTPPWESPDLAPDDVPLVIDPGMAFGTGSHPTTQLCLCALEDHVHARARVGDIGTGSGILAIAAYKLGAASVNACDIDPLAMRIAADNARANGVAVDVQEEMPEGPFDLIVCNILADTIMGLADSLRERLVSDGILIASGIIEGREADVALALGNSGFTALQTRRSGEWVAQIYRRD
jgi:ribosomal protein L11 methyltransferase